MKDVNIPAEGGTDLNECALAAEFGMRMAESYQERNGRALPQSDVEFAGALGIAFMLGRESIAGKVES